MNVRADAAGVERAEPHGRRFRLGSLRCRCESDPHGYLELLTDRYRSLFETSDVGIDDLLFSFRRDTSKVAATTDRLIVEQLADGHRLVTDPVTLELTGLGGKRTNSGLTTPSATLTITDLHMDREELSFHFWIIVNRALLLLDRVVLHAAAFVVDDRVIVVCGENGAGKSTLGVGFGLRGAAVLSDDSVLATSRHGTVVVSGMSPQMRVPRPTEDRLLPGRLDDLRISEDGRDKRLVRADQIFTSRWGEDLRPDRLVFLRPGDRVEVRPIGGRDALLRMIDNTRHSYRFGDTRDIADHLGLLSGLAAAVPAFEATRTDDLDDLDQLLELIGGS
jgi:hypothetical protein